MTKDRRLGRGLAALLGTPEDDLETTADATGFGTANSESAPATPALAASHATTSGLASGGTVNTGRPEPRVVTAAPPVATPRPETTSDLLQLNVKEIDENPFQPRRDFSEPEIASLAESLKEHDMLQPILVRRIKDRYQLISGERRWRAAIAAGWTTIPARIRQADDRLVAELAIVENLQRKDLNPIEKALSFKRYLDEHGCKQDDLAQRLKIDRSTIANLMRLLELPPPVLDALRRNELTAGHARALLPLGEEREQIAFAKQLIKEEWSVRETEQRVQEAIANADGEEPLTAAGKAIKKKPKPSNQVASLEQELRSAVGAKCEIKQSKAGRGRIIIHFGSLDDFDRIWQYLVDTPDDLGREAA